MLKTRAEFIRTYVQIQEELKIHIQEVKTNIDLEKANMEKYQKLIFDNKNEILNQNGCCVGAKLIFEVVSVKQSSIRNRVQSISVKMSLGTNSSSTSVRIVRNSEFNEKFEL